MRRGLSDQLSCEFENSIILSDEHKKLLLDWTQQTLKKGAKKWIMQYKASRDGFDCKKFHELCDGKGPTITVCHTTEGNFIVDNFNRI